MTLFSRARARRRRALPHTSTSPPWTPDPIDGELTVDDWRLIRQALHRYITAHTAASSWDAAEAGQRLLDRIGPIPPKDTP